MGSLKCKIPNMKELSLSPLVNDCPCLTQFILHSTPNQVEYLMANYSPCTPSLECDSLCGGLAEAARRVTEWVYLRELVIGGFAFGTIVKEAYRARELYFDHCQIDSGDELDFSGPDYRWVEAIYFISKSSFILIIWTD